MGSEYMMKLISLFSRAELELSLVGFDELEHKARFDLLDCDGNRLAGLTCAGVGVICATAHSALYRAVDWYDPASLPADIGWLNEGVRAAGGVLVFHLANDDDEEEVLQWGLPSFGRLRSAYITCRDFTVSEVQRA